MTHFAKMSKRLFSSPPAPTLRSLSFILAVMIGVMGAHQASAVWLPVGQTLAATATAKYQFGKSVTFTLEAQAPPERSIEEATLFIRREQSPSAVAIPVAVQTDSALTASYQLDLVAEPLAPFTTVTYWWAIRDDEGQRYSVAQQTLEYRDDRFAWEALEESSVTVYWAGQPQAIAQAALDQAQAARAELARVFPQEEDVAFQVYIYPSLADMQSALRLTGREYVGGHVFPENDVLLVWADNPRLATTELGQSVAHELSHLLMYRLVGADYWRVPRWFDEGVATHFEPSPRPEDELLLREAATNRELIPFDALCQTFPVQPDRLAYAQSASLIDYIEREYGTSALNTMARAAADGADCRTITTRGLGIELEELESNWRREWVPGPLVELSSRRIVWIILVGAGFLLMLFLIQFRLNDEQTAARQSRL